MYFDLLSCYSRGSKVTSSKMPPLNKSRPSKKSSPCVTPGPPSTRNILKSTNDLSISEEDRHGSRETKEVQEYSRYSNISMTKSYIDKLRDTTDETLAFVDDKFLMVQRADEVMTREADEVGTGSKADDEEVRRTQQLEDAGA